jgi:hypothetical protein
MPQIGGEICKKTENEMAFKYNIILIRRFRMRIILNRFWSLDIFIENLKKYRKEGNVYIK